jgi:hypothetical protein
MLLHRWALAFAAGAEASWFTAGKRTQCDFSIEHQRYVRRMRARRIASAFAVRQYRSAALDPRG